MLTLLFNPTAAAVTAKLPTLKTEIAFASAPGAATQTYTDVSAYVRSADTTRGRSDELARVEPGQSTTVVSNRDRRFEPGFSGGAYFPNVKLMRRIRHSLTWAGITYPIYTGFIQTVDQEYPAMNKDAVAVIRAADLFSVLNLHELHDVSYPPALSGARINSVLADAGVLEADRLLDRPFRRPTEAGQSLMADTGTLSGVTALSHILDVAESENGVFFISPEGKAVFQDRHHRILRRRVSDGSVSAAGLTYSALSGRFDESQLWNAVRITPLGGLAAVATDATSEADYFKRTYTRGFQIEAANEAADAANYLLGRLRQPAIRFDEVEVVAAQNATVHWPLVLGTDISRRLTVEHTTPNGGTITSDQFVEAIGYQITPDYVAVRMRFSPADVQDYAVWDKSSWDSTALWGY